MKEPKGSRRSMSSTAITKMMAHKDVRPKGAPDGHNQTECQPNICEVQLTFKILCKDFFTKLLMRSFDFFSKASISKAEMMDLFMSSLSFLCGLRGSSILRCVASVYQGT